MSGLLIKISVYAGVKLKLKFILIVFLIFFYCIFSFVLSFFA